MRLGILGGGVIARLILDYVKRGELGDVEPIAIMGRNAASRGKPLASEGGIAYVTSLDALLELKPDAVVEAASHDAVREYGVRLLDAGVSFIVLSCGALSDDALRESLEKAATMSGAMLYIPSGGIGGLDALKAVVAAGCDEAEIAVTKPPAAWKGITYVEKLGTKLDELTGPTVLFDGTAREGVPHFPANVNIAAALSLAGIGFDRTRLKVVADPALKFNTHYINIKGRTGRISIKFESVAFPENPKTSMLAAVSALAALKEFSGKVRYGT
jgi:aspartate dehydrogenase